MTVSNRDKNEQNTDLKRVKSSQCNPLNAYIVMQYNNLFEYGHNSANTKPTQKIIGR